MFSFIMIKLYNYATMSLETLFDPQTAFTSTGDPLLSPDTDFMKFVNPGSQNVSKAVQGIAISL